MIEAGVYEVRERCFAESLEKVVTDVFVVMSAVKASANGVI